MTGLRKAILVALGILLPVSLSTQSHAQGMNAAVLEAIPPGGCADLMAAQSAAAVAANSAPAFNVANLNRSVSPCTDFYEYSSGGWMKANPIPPEYSRWGTF